MSYKPNTTVYLLADTGMDMRNSIWWDKYAFKSGPVEYQGYWHGVKAHWFKAHSCNKGYWYMNMVNAYQGYVDVGRVPLNNGSIPYYEEGLVSGVDGYEVAAIPFSEVILGRCDYIMFSNGYETSMSQWYYAFIDKIESINVNVARVHFTIDAIETYGQYFNFGPSMVVRDMQFQERHEDNTPVPENTNYEPEPFTPQESDYIFQKFDTSQDIVSDTNFGQYNRMLVMTDVSLAERDITPNPYYGGLPSFKLSPSSVEGQVYLGCGTYYLPSRESEALNKLGSYNAAEHLLYTYMVPEKLTTLSGTSGEPIFLGDMKNYVREGFKGEKFYTLKTPTQFNDNRYISDTEQGFMPINLKCYQPPYTYVSIGDKQGGSLEIDLHTLEEYEVDIQHYFNLKILLDLSIAPNVGSCLYVMNQQEYTGGENDPMVTLWQMPSYAMTPNNSGYNSDYVDAMVQKRLGTKWTLIGAGMGMVGSLARAAVPLAASAMGVSGGLAGMGLNAASSGSSTFESMGNSAQSFGMRNLFSAITSEESGKKKEAFGLPKAMGGMAQGFTRFNMNWAGYDFFFVHLRRKLIEKIDMYFNIYGYQQNEFRYPNINTRRRWCFVQVEDLNIIDKGHENGVPLWAREQIIARMAAGVTFWNVRWALLGDDDENTSPLDITSFDDGRIQAVKGHRFVGNYGSFQTRAYMIENMSVEGGYCPDYTPYPGGDGLLEPE